MNLDQMKELEDLKLTLSNLEKSTHKAFLENVQPIQTKMFPEFINAFEKFFTQKGFSIEKNANIVSAIYNTLEFSVLVIENLIKISNKDTELANVYISYGNSNVSSSYVLPSDPYQAEKVRIKKEMERLNKNLELYQNPTFSFINMKNRKSYKSPTELLEDIFK